VDPTQTRNRKQHKKQRRSQSPKAPPGGGYRIPQVGQLQIVLKNPNKTAVKLFLIPYDLSEMEPGQKTFIRQRSYSAGPIVDMPLSSRSNYGTDRPEASLSGASDPKDRPVLRYLIHIHICCPTKNRFYLYQNIRVVFANRVPDCKEKLRSEIQMPEPRYSAYKPGREANTNFSSLAPPASELVNRRRSAVYPDTSHRISAFEHRQTPQTSVLSTSINSERFSVDSENRLFVKSMNGPPFRFPSVQRLPTLESRPTSRGMGSDGQSAATDLDAHETLSTSPPPALSPTLALPSRLRNLAATPGTTADENPEMVFSREASRERGSGGGSGGRAGESLLSRRLRDLEMRTNPDSLG